MKRSLSWIAALTVLVLLSFSFSGCGNEELPAYSSEISGEINGGGSTSVQKIIDAEGAEFGALHPAVKFTYSGTGSSDGIKNAANGTYSFGCASRELKESEKTDLTELVFAYDGIAVIVNDENSVEDLTKDQIKAIYTGKITNWKEVGGDDAEIVLIGREAGSGTRDGFESITGTEEACQYRQELTSTGDVITTVAGNPAAIGYASLASVQDSVKAVTVGGVAPTEETIADGSYAVQRPFILVTKEGKQLSDAAQAFFDYATSEAANEIITSAGVVPAAN